VLHEALDAVVRLLCAHRAAHLPSPVGALGGDSATSPTRPGPTVDESALTRDSIEIVVQVNGKVRARMEGRRRRRPRRLEAAALAQENAQRFMEGKTVRKVIVVPGKLVNIVVG
jgi:leucyl-tRNA synthetase